MKADALQHAVVGNVNALDFLQIDAVQRSQKRVLDVQGVALRDSGTETKAVEVGQTLEINITDRGQPREVESTEDLAIVQGERAANRLQA